MRIDGRTPDQARPVTIETDFVRTADGSCLIATGNTRVICTASVEEGVPPFLRGKGQGWVTAEYAMLPASTSQRKKRDGIKKDGRSVEIQRLIGRSIRQAVDMTKLGTYTITYKAKYLWKTETAKREVRVVDTTAPVITLKTVPGHLTLPGEETQITATITPITEGTALYHTHGGGWIYTFLDEEGEELSWTLPGGELSHVSLTVTMNAPPETLSLIQPMVTGKTIGG